MTAPFDHLTLLIDTDHLKRAVKAMAQQLRDDLAAIPDAENEPVLVVVLKGGVVFGMDLLRAIRRPMPVVFAPRAGQFTTTIAESDQALLRGRHLIVADTLMDSGNSLRQLYQWLATLQPLSIRLAVLLHKTVGDAEPLEIHYLGYEVPDVRLVGYGLDEEELFRGLPAIYTWWQDAGESVITPEHPPETREKPKKGKKDEAPKSR
ncbi:MAG: hypothetical protein H7835_18495 [Magnetococcus sp. XQGC-1]